MPFYVCFYVNSLTDLILLIYCYNVLQRIKCRFIHSRVYSDLQYYFSSFSFIMGIFLSGSSAADIGDIHTTNF